MSIPNFLKQDKLKLLMNTDGELIFYIPEIYFDRKFATVEGETYTLIGLFHYTLFSSSGNKVINTKMFKFPSTFMTIPTSVEIVKNLKLKDNMKPEDYRLLKYKKGSPVILSTKVSSNIENMEMFLKMLNSGKIPNSIPYEEIHEVFIENASINGLTYPASNQLIGVILSEMCRSDKDISTPYRLAKSGGYTMLNINELSKYSSPIASITGENWNDSMVTAITNDKYKRSPLETLFQA